MQCLTDAVGRLHKSAGFHQKDDGMRALQCGFIIQDLSRGKVGKTEGK